MKEITLTVKVEEVNLMLSALGNLPFIQVHELFTKIQTQATEQLAASNGSLHTIQPDKTKQDAI
jgi:hypothetical protein